MKLQINFLIFTQPICCKQREKWLSIKLPVYTQKYRYIENVKA